MDELCNHSNIFEELFRIHVHHLMLLFAGHYEQRVECLSDCRRLVATLQTWCNYVFATDDFFCYLTVKVFIGEVMVIFIL